MKVLIVDDHQMLREAIRRWLESVPDISGVYEAGNVADAISLISTVKPDASIVDVRLPDGSGFEICRAIKARYDDAIVIIFSAYAYEQYVRIGLRIGVNGFILKTDPLRSVTGALKTCSEGKTYFSPSIASLASKMIPVSGRSAANTRKGNLTPREIEVLHALADFKTNEEISQRLRISKRTVESHVSNVINKLGATSRRDAVALAVREKMV